MGNGDWDGDGGWVGLKLAGVCLCLREGFFWRGGKNQGIWQFGRSLRVGGVVVYL